MSSQQLFSRVRATGRLWNTLLVFLDVAVVVLATVLAYYTRFDGPIPPMFGRWMVPLVFAAVVVFGTLYALFGLYRLVLRFVGVDTLLKLSAATLLGSATLVVANFFIPMTGGSRAVPLGVLFIQGVLVFLGAASARIAARVYLYVRYRSLTHARRVLIVGAGSAGSLLLRELQNRRDLGLVAIGFLDDKPALKGRTISGVPVLGRTADLATVVATREVEEIMVAMPSAPRERIRAILNAAADANVHTRVMPALVIARGSVSLRDLRSVDVEDLLGREPTHIEVEEITDTLADKVVAVTGAAGSIGSELCRQIMKFEPKRLLLLEIDESRLYELWLELTKVSTDVPFMCICDIRDKTKIEEVFAAHRPQVVLHAAAYKHVPLMEQAPAEAVKTNVMGTRQLLDVCARHGVERFVLISTDKAVEPLNVMGLTKALAERVMLDTVARTPMNAVAVRFGNVLGSRGSVVPIFEEQLRYGGPLTVTDPSVTRYFMTIPEAARLVLQAQAIGQPGDIFVLEMGDPVRIVDLARKMIVLSGVPAEIEFVGLRPGEKLHETLTNESERLLPTERDRILRVNQMPLPEAHFADDIRTLIEYAVSGDIAQMAAAIEKLEPGFAQRDRSS
jgi:FlaA1/EpsC-like NDP-sugar epimerase